MENQVKTSTENKEQQLKKLSKMTMIRSLLPIAGLIIIFLMYNAPDRKSTRLNSSHITI